MNIPPPIIATLFAVVPLIVAVLVVLYIDHKRQSRDQDDDREVRLP